MPFTQICLSASVGCTPLRRHTRSYSPPASASSKVMRCTLYGYLPARMSLIHSLNGLASPSWVLITCTWPPQISSAIAALSSSPRFEWNAASSMITRPCLPRRLRGLLDSAVTR